MKYEKQPLHKAIFTVNNVLAFVVGNLLVINIWVQIQNIRQTDTRKAMVYAICQEARQEVNTASEQACGDAQDSLGIEYLCTQRNMLASNKCWVEVK